MASDRKLDLHLDLLDRDMSGLRSSAAHYHATDVASDDRFPDVDDILDRLTLNTKAVEKK